MCDSNMAMVDILRHNSDVIGDAKFVTNELRAELARLSAKLDKERMAEVLFMENSNGDWEALTENAQEEYLDAADALIQYFKEGKG
jgi:hypothetical protein